MANILGLHFGHDGSAAIVRGNKLVSAISSERLTRQKKSCGVTKEVIDYVLTESNLTLEQIDFVVLVDYFKINSNGIVSLYNENNIEAEFFTQQIFGNNIIGNFKIRVLDRLINAIIIPHHLAHCASAFYTSSFENAFCFSLDSSLGFAECNSLIAYGEGDKLTALCCPNLMIGNAYLKFTINLGLGDALYKAGSTMGLASYGKIPNHVKNNIKNYIGRSFIKGGSDSEFNKFWKEISGSDDIFTIDQKDSKKSMDIAASIQYIFEESILETIKGIQNEDIENLCLSGGSFLNCNVNSRILKESQFKNVHLFPACGDDGLVVGAALYVAHSLFNEPRNLYRDKDIAYLGKNYGSNFEHFDYAEIAEEINNGKIIAWFNGKSEYGPRALGNRSILADPRNFHNRELLNFMIKKREWFRPFAPVVLEDKLQDWFDFDRKSPFMLFTANVKNSKEVPGITHIDNSARMQTISKKMNEPYYNIVDAFYQLTNIPMLINTSLNGANEPILETPQDALNFFEKIPVDILVLNGKVIKR